MSRVLSFGDVLFRPLFDRAAFGKETWPHEGCGIPPQLARTEHSVAGFCRRKPCSGMGVAFFVLFKRQPAGRPKLQDHAQTYENPAYVQVAPQWATCTYTGCTVLLCFRPFRGGLREPYSCTSCALGMSNHGTSRRFVCLVLCRYAVSMADGAATSHDGVGATPATASDTHCDDTIGAEIEI